MCACVCLHVCVYVYFVCVSVFRVCVRVCGQLQHVQARCSKWVRRDNLITHYKVKINTQYSLYYKSAVFISIQHEDMSFSTVICKGSGICTEQTSAHNST